MDETRDKLLKAAGEVFAEVGFQAATVRDICTRAGTNVAAVNYHFGDKLALYADVLKDCVAVSESEGWRNLPDSIPAEQRLYLFVKFMFRNFQRRDKPAWQLKLMLHEMSHPSPALDYIVEQMIRPNFMKMSGLIGGMLGLPAADDRVRMCVFSVVSQIHFYKHAQQVVARLWPEMQMDDARIEQISTHIAEFSLAALRGLPKQKQEKE